MPSDRITEFKLKEHKKFSVICTFGDPPRVAWSEGTLPTALFTDSQLRHWMKMSEKLHAQAVLPLEQYPRSHRIGPVGAHSFSTHFGKEKNLLSQSGIEI